MEARYQNEKDFHNRAFGEGTRERVEKFYAVAQSSRRWFEAFVRAHCPGRSVLDYGCGTGYHAFALADLGARVTGIDLSDVAIQQATERAGRERREDVSFRVMNAEALDFDDDAFDLVSGTAILHHLDLERAYAELARVMRPTGHAIFIEPLGHNPLINLYRKLTPDLRTVDEHPLLMKDLATADAYFGRIETRYFHLGSLLAVLFRHLPGARWWLRLLDRVDAVLFAGLPFLRKHAWSVVIVFSQPIKSRRLVQAPDASAGKSSGRPATGRAPVLFRRRHLGEGAN